jgi:gliding motility-associated-like protein
VDAQDLYNQSIVSIGPSSIFYIKGTIINEGTIVNNGDMQIGGSWINHAQYEAGQGQITFNSNLSQAINHNDQSFNKLTISGGGEKIFQANITIDNELNLSDGILISENDARIIFSSSAVITGGSDHSHIRGPVYHQGSGNKVFPIGNGLLYLPFELLNIAGASSETGVRLVELQNNSLSKSPSLDEISANRYWQLDFNAASLANSAVVLPVRNETIVDNENDVVVAEAESPTSNFESMGQFEFLGNAADGKVTSDQFVSKPFLAVGMRSADDKLVVYNAVSANNDDRNDFLIIKNIENYPDNTFILFNRWGDKIFEMNNYDNKERVFRGRSNINGDKGLVSGTYFYIIETKKDNLKINGFIALKN